MLCSIGDDLKGLLWNIMPTAHDITAPLMQYESNSPLKNVAWSNMHSEWIGIIKNNSLDMLKVE